MVNNLLAGKCRLCVLDNRSFLFLDHSDWFQLVFGEGLVLLRLAWLYFRSLLRFHGSVERQFSAWKSSGSLGQHILYGRFIGLERVWQDRCQIFSVLFRWLLLRFLGGNESGSCVLWLSCKRT